MSLVKILSGEPMPRYPIAKNFVLDKYVSALHVFLRTLFRSFTAENIQATLDEESDVYEIERGLQLWVSATADGSVDLNTKDWRGRFVNARLAVCEATAAAALAVGDRDDEADGWERDEEAYFVGKDYNPAGDYVVLTHTFDNVIFAVKLDKDDGHLYLNVSNFAGGGSVQYQCIVYVWSGPQALGSDLLIS